MSTDAGPPGPGRHVPPRGDEPSFTGPAQRGLWYAARRAAFTAVLEAAAPTMFEDSLVLRGSTLMKRSAAGSPAGAAPTN